MKEQYTQLTHEPLLILPCAGMGTRVKPFFAGPKELMPSVVTGQPLIQFWLELGQKLNLPIHIITRSEKLALIEFVEQWKLNHHNWPITIQILDSLIGEWPSTVLQSKPFWHEQNILGLPDTYFAPLSTLEELVSQMKQKLIDVGILYHQLDELESPRDWGMVEFKERNVVRWCEKPVEAWKTNFAWGILSFSRKVGQTLLEELEASTQKHHAFEVSQSIYFTSLSLFKDLTRK